jgi:type II secretory pathway pseudopilin PulG
MGVMTKAKRLSLIEVMTIAVVLGMGSAGIAPKYMEASEEEKLDQLINGLQTMRGQLALYCVQHENRLPPTYSPESFRIALTTRVGEFGPYMKRMPVNPYNNLDTVRFDGEPAGENIAGWRFDTKDGSFRADNNISHGTL